MTPLTLAQKKFLCLSIAAIVVVNAGRATILHAGPPPKAKIRSKSKAGPEAGPRPTAPVAVVLDAPLEDGVFDLGASPGDWAAIEEAAEFGLSGADVGLSAPAAARAVACTPSAVSTGPGAWVGDMSDPNYARFRFPFRLTCTNVAGATEGCEPFIFVSSTNKMVGGVWTNISTITSTPGSLGCGQYLDILAHSQDTISIVNAANGGPGSYRTTMFVYKYSDFAASNWSAFLASSFYDWTY